jgi:murein DD-endopeptidase MepM/ murein hydrolase activator NlpD
VAGAAGHVHYEPPTDAPVIDPFRPPPGPYAAGNRGIEYRTVPGSPVRAAADGRVTFAGAIAGSLYVTLSHADGIRTSYSYLASIAVTPGEQVRLGQPVGTAGERLHVGARRGDIYIDPARLWLRGPPRVHLVPLDGGPPEQATVRPAAPPPMVGAVPAVRAAHGWRRFARWLA